MIAVDTNVLVRLVTNDNPSQALRAARLLRNHKVFIPKTVLLETEWVLRCAYELGRPAILRALRGILGLPGVTTEDPLRVASALAWYERSLDFADALHLTSSLETTRFVTFDERLWKKARRVSPLPVGRP